MRAASGDVRAGGGGGGGGGRQSAQDRELEAAAQRDAARKAQLAAQMAGGGGRGVGGGGGGGGGKKARLTPAAGQADDMGRIVSDKPCYYESMEDTPYCIDYQWGRKCKDGNRCRKLHICNVIGCNKPHKP